MLTEEQKKQLDAATRYRCANTDPITGLADESCWCDSCCYGTDKLAMWLIEALETIDKLTGKVNND